MKTLFFLAIKNATKDQEFLVNIYVKLNKAVSLIFEGSDSNARCVINIIFYNIYVLLSLVTIINNTCFINKMKFAF